MNCPHNLAFGLGQKGGSGRKSNGMRGNSLGCFGTIPHVLELKSKGNRRAIWVQMMHKTFQKLSEVAKVSVFMQMEQPANLGDEGAWID